MCSVYSAPSSVSTTSSSALTTPWSTACGPVALAACVAAMVAGCSRRPPGACARGACAPRHAPRRSTAKREGRPPQGAPPPPAQRPQRPSPRRARAVEQCSNSRCCSFFVCRIQDQINTVNKKDFGFVTPYHITLTSVVTHHTSHRTREHSRGQIERASIRAPIHAGTAASECVTAAAGNSRKKS